MRKVGDREVDVKKREAIAEEGGHQRQWRSVEGQGSVAQAQISEAPPQQVSPSRQEPRGGKQHQRQAYVALVAAAPASRGWQRDAHTYHTPGMAKKEGVCRHHCPSRREEEEGRKALPEPCALPRGPHCKDRRTRRHSGIPGFAFLCLSSAPMLGLVCKDRLP